MPVPAVQSASLLSIDATLLSTANWVGTKLHTRPTPICLLASVYMVHAIGIQFHSATQLTCRRNSSCAARLALSFGARCTPTAAPLPCRAAAGAAAAQPAPATQSAQDCSVVARDLSVRLGEAKHEVLRQVNLDVKRGSLHMLLGPDGCGKSTFLRVLGGLIPEYT